MSRELVMSLYERMVSTKDAAEARIINDIYISQDYKNNMTTEYFNKKCAELEINEISKKLNNNNVGMATDCRIDIVKAEGRLFPLLSLLDKDKKSVQVSLSLATLEKINKEIETAKAILSCAQYVGI